MKEWKVRIKGGSHYEYLAKVVDYSLQNKVITFICPENFKEDGSHTLLIEGIKHEFLQCKYNGTNSLLSYFEAIEGSISHIKKIHLNHLQFTNEKERNNEILNLFKST